MVFLCFRLSMQLSKDRSQIISVSNDDIKEGYFIIPDTVTYIEYEAFRGCTELRTLCLPRKDITISCHAFIGCTNLTTIQLPEGATIGQDKFTDCTELKYIVVDTNQDDELSRINGLFKSVLFKVLKKSTYSQILHLQNMAYQKIIQDPQANSLFPNQDSLGLVVDILPLISAYEGKEHLASQLLRSELAKASFMEIEGQLDKYKEYLDSIVQYVKLNNLIIADQRSQCAIKLEGYVNTIESLIEYKCKQHPRFFACKPELDAQLCEQLMAVKQLILYLREKVSCTLSSKAIDYLSQGFVGKTLKRYNVDLYNLPLHENGLNKAIS